ncbi:MAG TPA: HAD-IIIC family phosphatase [Gemmataceae bacterium]|nr:HAD-IIIC family phosphatase [Gemmataceae bacterium]
MKFADALKTARAEPPAGAQPLSIALVCGCTADVLQTFLTAHLRRVFPDRRVTVETGLYGDCLGNLQRASQSAHLGIAVVVEWADLDARLGLRQTGGWSPNDLPDILATLDARAAHFEAAVQTAAASTPVAVCLPTLPLPPVAFTPGWTASNFETRLRSRLQFAALRLSDSPNVGLVSAQRLDHLSPPAGRLNVKSDLLSGFPYQTTHASAVAEMLAALLRPPAPKKGLITDLDDTLWRGLLGEVGADGVSWNLDRRSHAHGLYQQMLQSLADAGVLIAVASKNGPLRVEEALRRPDLLLKPDRLFPVEANWGPKSESIGRILRAWNVGADSVVFIDDSPLELAEVKAAHPGLEAVLFPKNDDQAVYDLLWRLRDLFGKSALRAEDHIRRDSLRRAAEAPAADPDAFLRGMDGEIVVAADAAAPDPRALELVNKTNQFNLNGRRFSEGEWRSYLHRPGGFLYVVAYKDKFGPLGKIAVIAGRRDGAVLLVDTWVMSCRAFSRRIEHQCVRLLFDRFPVEEIAFDYRPTDRNGPCQDFFAALLGGAPSDVPRLTRDLFASECPPLFHRVKVIDHG